MRLKIFKIFALSFCLFATAQMLNAESFDKDAMISLMRDPQLMLRSKHQRGDRDDNDNRAKKNCKSKVKPLKLKDFEGAWVFRRETLGGLGGATSTGTPSIGASVIIDGQVVFDRNGHGVVNFASSAEYDGVPGNVTNITIPPGDATVTLTITDPVNGIGTFNVSVPLIVFDETADLIAFRSKSNGCVIKFIGHRTSMPVGGAFSVTRYTIERQFQ